MSEYNFDDPNASIKRFELMLKTNEVYFFDALEFEDIVVHYLGLSKIQLAKRALHLGLEQHPENIELLLLQSEMLILDEKYEPAAILLEHINLIDPENEEVLLQKATLASKTGKHKEAIRFLKIALKLTEDPFDIWNLLGMEYLLQENFEEAATFFKKCNEDNHEDYHSLYNLIYCYEQLQDDQAAINALNAILEKDPYSEVAWHQLGRVYSRIGKIKEAISAFDFALISDESFTGAYVEKAKLLEKEGRINEAITNYEWALKTNEPSAFIYQRIGFCHLKLGNDQLAVEFFLEAVHLEPTSERGWSGLIDLYIEKENYQKAQYYIRKALKANGDSIELWRKSAIIHQNLKLPDEVIDAFQNMLDLGDFGWTTWVSCIDGWIGMEDWNKALEIAHKAKSFFPDDAELDYRIAGCHHRLNQSTEANYFFQNAKKNKEMSPKITQLFPEFKQARILQNLLK